MATIEQQLIACSRPYDTPEQVSTRKPLNRFAVTLRVYFAVCAYLGVTAVLGMW